MKESEIIEGNKLIAEFMGGKYDKNTSFPIHPDDIWLPVHGIVNFKTIELGKGKALKYHSSWDWLMPIINKIYESDWYYKWKDTSGQFEKEVFINTKFIDETWKQVVEFIKWWNEQTKK